MVAMKGNKLVNEPESKKQLFRCIFNGQISLFLPIFALSVAFGTRQKMGYGARSCIPYSRTGLVSEKR